MLPVRKSGPQFKSNGTNFFIDQYNIWSSNSKSVESSNPLSHLLSKRNLITAELEKVYKKIKMTHKLPKQSFFEIFFLMF